MTYRLGGGAASLSRRNPEIGALHYTAVVAHARGRGLGRLLGRHQGRALRDLGILRLEGETQVKRRASLWLQFSCGLEPRYEPDEWNTPDGASPLMRAIANERLKRLHREWQCQAAS